MVTQDVKEPAKRGRGRDINHMGTLCSVLLRDYANFIWESDWSLFQYPPLFFAFSLANNSLTKGGRRGKRAKNFFAMDGRQSKYLTRFSSALSIAHFPRKKGKIKIFFALSHLNPSVFSSRGKMLIWMHFHFDSRFSIHSPTIPSGSKWPER